MLPKLVCKFQRLLGSWVLYLYFMKVINQLITPGAPLLTWDLMFGKWSKWLVSGVIVYFDNPNCNSDPWVWIGYIAWNISVVFGGFTHMQLDLLLSGSAHPKTICHPDHLWNVSNSNPGDFFSGMYPRWPIMKHGKIVDELCQLLAKCWPVRSWNNPRFTNESKPYHVQFGQILMLPVPFLWLKFVCHD